MRCKHCRNDCGAVKWPWTGPNKMSGVDLVSDCCWEDITDDTGRTLSQEEIRNAIREERIAHDS